MRSSPLMILTTCACLTFLSSPALSAEAWGYWKCVTHQGDALVKYSTRPQLFSYHAPPKPTADPSADFMTNMLAEGEWDMDNWAAFAKSQPDEEKRFRLYMQESHRECSDGSLLSPPFNTEAEALEAQKPTQQQEWTDQLLIKEMDGVSSVRYESINWPPQ